MVLVRIGWETWAGNFGVRGKQRNLAQDRLGDEIG